MKRAEIAELLPEIFRRTLGDDDRPLAAFLDVMETLQAPDEAIVASLDTYFDPRRAPDPFATYLAGWLDLDDLWIENPAEFTAKTLPPFPGGAGRLRELVSLAVYLSKWRGTEKALLAFLETATGVKGFTIDQQPRDHDDEPIPFHIVVHAPAGAAAYRPLVERIIVKEKPAYVTYELIIEA